MTPDANDASGRAPRVDEAIAAYLEAADAGRPPAQSEFLARHADIAGELEAFFADRERFQRAAQPIAPGAAGDAATVAPDTGAADGSLGKVRYFGDYELLAEIARGGMGVVYKARQVSLDRVVALKMIRAGQLASPADVQRFHTEARAAAALKHANIVAIHEVGEHQGQHFFSMDYIAGKSLAEVVRENPLPAARAARYAQTIADAIHHAHLQDTLHRDLKPSNVLIDEADQPHVTDFGLAKQIKRESGLTVTGQILGTPSYMPPEQAAGRTGDVGRASDVYSLGALLYELLTGRPPFRAESVFDTIVQVVNTEPVPPRMLNPKVPRDLDTICLKCLEKDPKKRFGSARELAEDLGRFLTGEPIQARPPSVPFVVRHWFRQNLRATAWAVGIGLVSGLLMSGVGLFHWAQMAADVHEAYDAFPSLDPPWFTFEWLPPIGLTAAMFGVLFVVLLLQGPVAVLIVRPANRAGEVAVSAAVGLLCGLTFFTLTLGPILTFQLGTMRSQQDIYDLAAAADGTPGQLLRHYPDMGNLPPTQGFKPGFLLSRKIFADQEARGPHVLWMAMALSLLPVPVAVVLALVAGIVLRRGDRSVWAAVWDYNPSALPLMAGALLLVPLILLAATALGFFPADTPWWYPLDSLPLMAAATLAKRHKQFYREWIWRRHRALTGVLVVASFVSAVRCMSEVVNFVDTGPRYQLVQFSPWPRYVDLVVYAVTLVVTMRYLAQQRRAARQ